MGITQKQMCCRHFRVKREDFVSEVGGDAKGRVGWGNKGLMICRLDREGI